jgi:hypothetical protein
MAALSGRAMLDIQSAMITGQVRPFPLSSSPPFLNQTTLIISLPPSFLVMQTLFRRQLEALRQKLALTTSAAYQAEAEAEADLGTLGDVEDDQHSLPSSAPSLALIKAQFAENRAKTAARYQELLARLDQ